MKILSGICRYAIVLLILGAATPVLLSQTSQPKILHATAYDSNFPKAGAGGEAFNGLGVAHDGTVYYVISSGKFNIPGEMYSLNPKTKVITHISNLNDATGQGDIKAI